MKSSSVFISYSHQDREFVEKLARALMDVGINVWFDHWEIQPSDSLVQKIFEEGLANADVFIVVLSKISVSSPWVQEEISTATLRRIQKVTRVIPVLKEDVDIPAALKTVAWVDMRADFDGGVRKIVNAINGILEKPEIDSPPPYLARMEAAESGLSKLATTVAKYYLHSHDPNAQDDGWFIGDPTAKALDLSPEELNDAVDELKELDLVKTGNESGGHPFNFTGVIPTFRLYLHFSQSLSYDPTADVRIVTATAVALGTVGESQLLEKTGLSIGRLKRAVRFIEDRELAHVHSWGGTSIGEIIATRKTRQFVASES
jgi:hypothetical protein